MHHIGNDLDNLVSRTLNAFGKIDKAQLSTLQNAYLTLRDIYHQLTLADDKFADETDEIDAMRADVTAVWQSVFEQG